MKRSQLAVWAALVVAVAPARVGAGENLSCQELSGFWIRSSFEENGRSGPAVGGRFTLTVAGNPDKEATEPVPGFPRYLQDGPGAQLTLTFSDSMSGEVLEFTTDVYDMRFDRGLDSFAWGGCDEEHGVFLFFTVDGPQTPPEFFALKDLAGVVTSADVLDEENLEIAAHGALTSAGPCGAQPPMVKTRTPPANLAPLEPTQRGGLSAATCSIPCRVYLHNGEEHFERTDLVIPGRGDIHFAMKRSYRSRLEYDGPLGHGWDFSYNEALFPQENGDVARSNGTGRVDTWTLQPDGSYDAPPGFFRTLVKQADGSFLTRSPEGFRRRYSADGRLEVYVDRNGNVLRFEYDVGGNLARVIDPFGRVVEFEFESFPDGVDRLVTIRDFIGREVVYGYDERGDLSSVRSPVVEGTSTGNDFPAGRTERYAYSSGFAEPTLNHNLLSVTFPQEVADDGPPGMVWAYGEDDGDAGTFDRVVTLSLGGGRVNASGVAAGGNYTIEYESLNDGIPLGDVDVPRGKARVTEPNGNVIEYFANELHQHIRTRRFTRGLRENEPEFYETRSFFDADGQLVRRVHPAGNEVRYTYDAGARAAEQNVIEVRRIADPERGGGEDLVTTFTYEPLYRGLASVTDPRGNAPGFEPPLGDATAERYTTRFVYDYQEGSEAIAGAEIFGIDIGGVERALGDLNGDGRSDQTAGNPVRRVAPTVQLLEGPGEAERLGTTAQSIVTDFQWNDHGQMLQRVDPEGNVTVLDYYPANDPDGDGELVVADAGAGDAVGYLRSETVDALDSPRRMSLPPVALRTSFRYDPVGNVISSKNPRGVVIAFEVNQLNEPVVVTRGADVSGGVASGQLITGEAAFEYLIRRTYDHNGRLVGTETENREDVSTTAGVGAFLRRTFTYDLLDNLVERTVEVDAETTLVWRQRYDPQELATLFTEPEGNEQQVTWDERNLPLRFTRGLGSPGEATREVHYDLNANPTRLVDAEDNDADGEPESTLLAYDGFDRLTAVTDALGNQSLTGYDVASNVVRRRRFGHPPTGAGPGGGGAPNVLLSDVHLRYDELHRLFQIDEALFLSEGFDPARPVELQDENSDGFVTSRFEYDRDSRPTFTIEDDLEVTEAIFDGADRSVERIDHLGNRLVTDYDQNSNPVRVRSIELSPEALVPEEEFTTYYVYDQLDRLVTATDNLGQTTRFGYDSRDNLTRRSDPEGPLTDDPFGRFPGEINEAGNTTTWSYDGLERRILEVRDLRTDGGGSPVDLSNSMNPDGRVRLAYAFDGNSRLTGIVDDNENRTAFGYDALNRRVSQENADSEQFLFAYDRDDNLTEVTDPNGSVVRSAQDVLNRLVGRDVERAPGVGGTTRETYGYDGLHRLTRRTDDNGAAATTTVCEVVYDSLSRLREERQGGGSTAGSRTFIRGDCDGDGSIRGLVTDAISLLTFNFLGGPEPTCLAACDADGDGSVRGEVTDVIYLLRFNFLGGPPPPPPFPDCGAEETAGELGCASHTFCGGGAGETQPVGIISTVFAGDGKRLSCAYPGGRTIVNTFDAIDRTQRTTDANGLIAEYSWIGGGYRELRRLLGNGTSLSYLDDAGGRDFGYDGVKRVVRERCFLRDGVTTFLDREYGYNRADMRTAEKRNDDLGLTDIYTYDSTYRLERTEFDQDGLVGESPRDRSQINYMLDGVGNRRQVDTLSTSSGAAIETLSVNEMNEYTAVDAVSRTHDPNGNLIDDGSRQFEYDYRNRVIGVSETASGAPIARYVYYADNRRAKKIVFNTTDPGAVDTTSYFYDRWQVCEEQNASGETEVTYVWSPTGIDRLLQLERTAAHPLGAGAFYTHQNARGDVVAVTDGTGNVVETLRYDDFGNPDRMSSVGNPYLFQGRRLDPETGLYYFRNRYYDPGTGRFLERDPVWDARNAGGWYTFAGNGPVSRGDAFGLEGGAEEESEPKEEFPRAMSAKEERKADLDAMQTIRQKTPALNALLMYLFLDEDDDSGVRDMAWISMDPLMSLAHRVETGEMFIAHRDYATYLNLEPIPLEFRGSVVLQSGGTVIGTVKPEASERDRRSYATPEAAASDALGANYSEVATAIAVIFGAIVREDDSKRALATERNEKSATQALKAGVLESDPSANYHSTSRAAELLLRGLVDDDDRRKDVTTPVVPPASNCN